MRKIALVLAVLICAALLPYAAGCSGKNIDMAFISSLDTSDAASPAANCLEGVASYAAENNLAYAAYQGSSQKQIDKAVKAGAEVIVLFAVDDENAVYSCTGKYPDVKFICVDFGNDFLVRSNVCCINVSKLQCGVYAGYSAVKEGNLTLGIQGEESAETYNYIKGFIEGAQIAAVEIGVSKKPVNIYYNVSGSDMITERVASWYGSGCKMIFCSDETYGYVSEYVTDSDIHKIMTFGADRVGEEDIAASVYSDYRKAVREHIGYAFSGDFRGGMMFSAGAADGSAGFSYDSSAFEVLTDTDIEKLTEKISESDISLIDYYTYKTPSDKGYSKIVLTETGIIADDE